MSLSTSENNTLTSLGALPTSSASEVLHKFPVIHIGWTAAGKLHSINDVIQKVLSESKPSQTKEVSMWLSIAQVQLVNTKNGREEIVEAHETSRIRAIGVYSQDKRFIGYIIKEEGKPLMGHVLRCNSAGLMVSLMSFLRQSCQLTSYQRGGSFYDELSTDDSDDWEQSGVSIFYAVTSENTICIGNIFTSLSLHFSLPPYTHTTGTEIN